MLIFKNIGEITAYITALRKNNEALKIGFAPTMGALHEGHLSLLHAARADGALTVCSIFVNPTQFNDPNDLEKYPRPLQADLDLLASVGCDLVFLPEVSDIYPDGTAWRNPFEFGELVTVMEGAFRPGHFDGMVQVVKRLLDIVQPDFLYMGQKDFQQQTIVQSMLLQMRSPCKLVRCAILREADGLAMSSRNVRLSPTARQIAPQIYAALQWAKAQKQRLSPPELCAATQNLLLKNTAFSLDYLEIVDSTTLLPLAVWSDAPEAVLCLTARLDGLRLLDNEILG